MSSRPFQWVESWPALIVGALIVIAIGWLRADGVL